MAPHDDDLTALSAPLVPGRLVKERWELAGARIDQALQDDLVVAFVGAASAGKDAAILALFGVDFGEVDPIPGTTDRLRAVPLDAAGRVVVVNAPGFGDLRDDVNETTRQLVDRLDVALYLVNADGGATEDERRALDRVRALGRPVLVCINKIDLIRPHQREAFLSATLHQLGVQPEDAVTTAFDPMPALSPAPIGIDAVADWITRMLTDSGKALLFAKQLRNRAVACEPLIRSAARKAALAGAIPVPGADMTAVTAIQVQLISDIAAVYDQKIDQDIALFIMGEALAGAGRGFARWATRALKTAGWIPGGQLGEIAASAMGASIASASTYGVGQAAIAYIQRLKEGRALSAAEVRDVFDRFAFAWKDGRIQPGSPQRVVEAVADEAAPAGGEE
jgi:GTP-binding protein Era